MPRAATNRHYTKRQKLVAVVAADMTTGLAASRATGVPRSTLQHWLDDPELARYRQNAREEVADEVRVVARLAWEKLGEAIRSGRMEPRDLVLASGMAMDKLLLLSGEATARTETRDLTGDLNDHERAQLRDILDAVLEEPAASGAGADPVGAGTEVRQ